MHYTTEDMLAWLKELSRKDSACPNGGVHKWSVSEIKEDNPVLGWTSYDGFFSVACTDCGYNGLFNARELIGKYGELE